MLASCGFSRLGALIKCGFPFVPRLTTTHPKSNPQQNAASLLSPDKLTQSVPTHLSALTTQTGPPNETRGTNSKRSHPFPQHSISLNGPQVPPVGWGAGEPRGRGASVWRLCLFLGGAAGRWQHFCSSVARVWVGGRLSGGGRKVT